MEERWHCHPSSSARSTQLRSAPSTSSTPTPRATSRSSRSVYVSAALRVRYARSVAACTAHLRRRSRCGALAGGGV